MKRPSPLGPSRVDIALALSLCAWQLILALPQVGQATFLGDQLDQIGQFMRLLDGDATALYGPVMSGTSPNVFALGPLSAFVFGVPTVLGLDPDGLHRVLIGILSASTALFYLSICRYSRILALAWCVTMLASSHFWWNHSMLWAPVLNPVAAMALIAASLHLLDRPTWPRALIVLSAACVGPMTHAPTFLGFGIAGLVIVYSMRRSRVHGARLRPVILAASLLTAMVLPYAIAEVMTHGANLRAVMANVQDIGARPERRDGIGAAVGALSMLWEFQDWLPRFNGKPTTLLGLGALVGLALGILTYVERSESRRVLLIRCLGLVIAAVISTALFFIFANRPLLGRHYTSFLLPFFAIPFAGIAYALLSRIRQESIRRAALILLIVLAALHSRGAAKAGEKDPRWNFSNIRTALQDICARDSEIDVLGQPEFTVYAGEFPDLLHYVGKKYVPYCSFKDGASVLLVPNRAGLGRPTIRSANGDLFSLRRLVEPGIGVYDRLPTAR